MGDSYAEEYQQLFDEFVSEHNLEFDDKYWTPEQRIEWAQIYLSFQQLWQRDSML